MTTDIAVWKASLDADAERLVAWRAVLSPDECARAERLRSPEHRAQFVAAHGQLREVLGACLDIPPARVEFRQAAQGKPGLGAACAGALEFSMSHSGTLALFAVAQDRPVGVDVERIRPDMPFMEVARRFYSTSECRELESLPPERRARAFFQTWTRKEAHAKATGQGLSARIAELSAVPSGWSLRVLDVGPDYAAALCAPGTDWQPVCRRWP